MDRGESVHQLQRTVYSGKVAPERGRRLDEMKTICGSHGLLTNIVLACNTSWVNETVMRLRGGGVRIEDDWLRRMGPAHFSRIKFRGTMGFGNERPAQSLLQVDSASMMRTIRWRLNRWCGPAMKFFSWISSRDCHAGCPDGFGSTSSAVDCALA